MKRAYVTEPCSLQGSEGVEKQKLLDINEKLVRQLERNMQTLEEMNKEMLHKDQRMMTN